MAQAGDRASQQMGLSGSGRRRLPATHNLPRGDSRLPEGIDLTSTGRGRPPSDSVGTQRVGGRSRARVRACVGWGVRARVRDGRESLCARVSVCLIECSRVCVFVRTCEKVCEVPNMS